jgi:hypothetical protein
MLQLGRSKLSKILFESGCFDTWLHNKLYTMLLSPSIYSNVNHVKIIAFWFNSPSCSHIKKTILLNYLCIGSIANDHVNIILIEDWLNSRIINQTESANNIRLDRP